MKRVLAQKVAVVEADVEVAEADGEAAGTDEEEAVVFSHRGITGRRL